MVEEFKTTADDLYFTLTDPEVMYAHMTHEWSDIMSGHVIVT